MRKIENLKFKIENLGISFLLVISSLFKRKASSDIRKMEFSTSTQRLGLSFTDKVRDVFRRRWIKKS